MTAPIAGSSMNNMTGWSEVSCDTSDSIRNYDEELGGYGAVNPTSSFTNMERSNLGVPVLYTEWERNGKPVLRDYRPINNAGIVAECRHYAPTDCDHEDGSGECWHGIGQERDA